MDGRILGRLTRPSIPMMGGQSLTFLDDMPNGFL